MQVCPYCSSSDIYYSKKRKNCLCGNCDRSFNEPALARGMRIFISYGHDKNQELVHSIKNFLISNGYDIWIDTSCIHKGQDWRERITDGLMACNGVIAFLSRHSVRNPGVCLDELRIATRLKRAYIKPILLEDHEEVKPPYHLADIQWINMEDWRSIPPDKWEAYFAQKMHELLEALESDDALLYEKQMQKLARILRCSESIAKEQRLLRNVFIGRKWLTKMVQDWLDHGLANRMVLLGVPGAGKSSFAANLSQHHVDVIASVFLEWDKPEVSMADKVVCQLAFKLAAEVNDYRKMLLDRLIDLNNAMEYLSSMQANALFDWLILEPISCCLGKDDEKSLIIIDGLDEVSEDTARFLFRKVGELPRWIYALFTTRNVEVMMPTYNTAYTVLLDGASPSNREDIAQYVEHRLGTGMAQDIAGQIVEKSEGSFIYVKTLCDALVAQQIQPKELPDLPTGISEFYENFMHRLFPTMDQFIAVRPFFELLSTEDTTFETVVCLCMGYDTYELWELRRKVSSLVVSNINKGRYGKTHRVIQFAHKTIRSWISNQILAGCFYVNPQNGYSLLFHTCDRLMNNHDEISAGLSKLGINMEDSDLQLMLFNNYHYWMVKAGFYNQYRQILLVSFDDIRSKGAKVIHADGYNHMYYYRFYDLWKWADELSANAPVDDLVHVLEEIVSYPCTQMCGMFAHRSFQFLYYC